MPKLKINHVLIIFGIVIIALFLFRFLSPEDSWICQNGEWVAHGHPAIEKPDTSCKAN